MNAQIESGIVTLDRRIREAMNIYSRKKDDMKTNRSDFIHPKRAFCKQFLSLTFLFSLLGFNSAAQDQEPTKEETVHFLDRIVKSEIGHTMTGECCSPKGSVWVTTSASFDWGIVTVANEISEPFEKRGDGATCHTRSEIPWHTYTGVSVDSSYTKGFYDVLITFRDNMKHSTSHKCGTDPYHISYGNRLGISVPYDKIKSVKKAILRLVEIAKGENKDPFEN